MCFRCGRPWRCGGSEAFSTGSLSDSSGSRRNAYPFCPVRLGIAFRLEYGGKRVDVVQFPRYLGLAANHWKIAGREHLQARQRRWRFHVEVGTEQRFDSVRDDELPNLAAASR